MTIEARYDAQNDAQEQAAGNRNSVPGSAMPQQFVDFDQLSSLGPDALKMWGIHTE